MGISGNFSFLSSLRDCFLVVKQREHFLHVLRRFGMMSSYCIVLSSNDPKTRQQLCRVILSCFDLPLSCVILFCLVVLSCLVLLFCLVLLCCPVFPCLCNVLLPCVVLSYLAHILPCPSVSCVMFVSLSWHAYLFCVRLGLGLNLSLGTLVPLLKASFPLMHAPPLQFSQLLPFFYLLSSTKPLCHNNCIA
jgi:hypothetical protein